MKQHTGIQTLAESSEACEERGGALLGWYTTAEGRRRHVRLIGTDDYGLCVIDAADDGAVLIEPLLEDFDEARAIAADYLARAAERGEPLSRHPWPPVVVGSSS